MAEPIAQLGQNVELDEDANGDAVLRNTATGTEIKLSDAVEFTGALGTSDNPLESVHTEDLHTTDVFNGALIAHPDHRSVQETFDIAEHGDTIIILGSHEEHDIVPPVGNQTGGAKRLDIIFWDGAEIVNNATDGSHTIRYQDSEVPVAHKWINPQLEGNSDCGCGFWWPDGDNRPNQFAIISPQISGHGGYGVRMRGPVATRITGDVTQSNWNNNGLSKTHSCHIRIEGSSTTTVVENQHMGGGMDRDIWWTAANGSGVRANIHETCETGLYLEDCYAFTIQGPYWFESSNVRDIYWEGDINRGGLGARPSIQRGSVRWNGGVELVNYETAIKWDDFAAGPNTSRQDAVVSPRGVSSDIWGTIQVPSGGQERVDGAGIGSDSGTIVGWHIDNPENCDTAEVRMKQMSAYDTSRVVFEELTGGSFTEDPIVRFKFIEV